jgi:hypothetical protein
VEKRQKSVSMAQPAKIKQFLFIYTFGKRLLRARQTQKTMTFFTIVDLLKIERQNLFENGLFDFPNYVLR